MTEYKAIEIIDNAPMIFEKDGMITCPKLYDIKDDEMEALEYLCNEWDYGFIRR